jgi:phosphoglycolate phosphatase-like HAD superfamily hydrolase
MVGDYKYDVMAGRAAGMRTALLLLGEKRPPWLDEVRPDHLLRRLDDLRALFPV